MVRSMQIVEFLIVIVVFFLYFMIIGYPGIHKKHVTVDMLQPCDESVRESRNKSIDDERVEFLMDLWNKSLEQRNYSILPRAPHFQDCKQCSSNFAKLDSRGPNGEWPRWTRWRAALGVELGGDVSFEEEEEKMLFNNTGTVEGPYPPWIQGSDEDNLPMTRRAQRDIWLHQHPKNCSEAKFLVPEWRSVLRPGRVGVGAEIWDLAGWLAVAMKENRVLVTKNYHGADHPGCNGPGHSRWSCYFLPEASQECVDRAMHLATQKSAWKTGLITSNRHYGHLFNPFRFKILEFWGKPWESSQITVLLNEELLPKGYRGEDRRWWRAQAVKYLMRFPSEYLCNLLNQARHNAFGEEAARLVVPTLPHDWPKVQPEFEDRTPMEKYVWSASGPWIPRPMLSLHVRQGDKGREMKLFDFEDYMQLCNRLRSAKPHVRNIWLSTEMQNVIEESMKYGRSWNFYFTIIDRQRGTQSMTDYMGSLGKRRSFDNSYVNLFMAVDSDYFVGALGSTWSDVIDSLRVTSGKTMAGFLSVNALNKD